MYQLAPSWRGQVLPPGVLGYPRSHPNVYSYARPVYIPGRGFVTLGLGRRGLGQSGASALNPADDPCSGFFGFLSPSCWAELGSEAVGTSTANQAAGGLPSGSAGIVVTTPLAPAATINPGPSDLGVLPNGMTTAQALAAQQAASNAAIAQTQVNNAVANSCPAGMYVQTNGSCGSCPAGYTQNADGSCSQPVSWTTYAIYAAIVTAGLLVLAKL